MSFLSPEFNGAFLGAFFAFLFGIISYRVIKRSERLTKHRNALISLERLLNKHLDLIGINRNCALNTTEILRRHVLTHNRLIDLPLKENLGLDLGNLDVINHYFMYERSVHRVNIDSESLNYILTRFEDVMIGGSVLASENWNYVISAMEQIPGYLNKLEKNTKRLLSLTRINIRYLNNKGIWYANTNEGWEVGVSEKEMREELVILDKEIKKSSSN